ncbi:MULTISPECIES: HAD family hydrolase [Cupriavidus]
MQAQATAGAAVFDLDGTLIDAAADIAAALAPGLAARGLAPLALAEAKSLLGDGLRVFARRAFVLRAAEITRTEENRFIDRYLNTPIGDTRLYPEVEATLHRLRRDGWKLAVCTNKVEAAAVDILAQLGILPLFETVCGGDTVPACKPAPVHLAEAIRRAGLQAMPAVMIGDNPADVLAAAAYGIPAVFAQWGYGRLGALQGTCEAAARFADLPALLGAIRHRRPA